MVWSGTIHYKCRCLGVIGKKKGLETFGNIRKRLFLGLEEGGLVGAVHTIDHLRECLSGSVYAVQRFGLAAATRTLVCQLSCSVS